jgi:nucleoside-diphosphate-sugar epimerase
MIKNSKVIVVGGAGFVGSNLLSMLLKKGVAKILVIDNLLSSVIENIPKDSRIEFINASVSSKKALKHIVDEFDYIFHLATFHGNQSSIARPMEDFRNNNETTITLLNHIIGFNKLKKMVYSGAGCASAKKTFSKAKATVEDTSVSLLHDSPYSMSKLIGEMYCRYFHKAEGVPAVTARFQNVYGPGEVLGAGKWRGTPATVWRNVTPTFIYRSLKGDTIPLENGGVATRDFIYVEDICRGLIACATEGRPGEAYNLASGVETGIKDLCEKVNGLCGNKSVIELKPKRFWDNSGKRFGSIEKSKIELGFEAKVSIDDGLKKTVTWTISNMELIEKCINKHKVQLRKNNS